MLYYGLPEADLPPLRAASAVEAGVGGVPLHTSLAAAQAAAQAAGGGAILAVDPEKLEARVPLGDGRVFVARVPAAAFCNLDPYLPPRAVTAGGGYVMRVGDSGPEVLLIHRRGVWDLPKGKQNLGETVPDCALREVREEVGIRTLTLVQPLGATVHGYADGDAFAVKTTHWFRMQTPETDFTPERREGIERVEWTPWEEAQRRLGFFTLRRHMQQIAQLVRSDARSDAL